MNDIELNLGLTVFVISLFSAFVTFEVLCFLRLKNPCKDDDPCKPTYSFHNDLPLSSNIDEFVSSVENVTHSSNLDSPEGVLDAMMQAIVCRVSLKRKRKTSTLSAVLFPWNFTKR